MSLGTFSMNYSAVLDTCDRIYRLINILKDKISDMEDDISDLRDRISYCENRIDSLYSSADNSDNPGSYYSDIVYYERQISHYETRISDYKELIDKYEKWAEQLNLLRFGMLTLKDHTMRIDDELVQLLNSMDNFDAQKEKSFSEIVAQNENSIKVNPDGTVTLDPKFALALGKGAIDTTISKEQFMEYYEDYYYNMRLNNGWKDIISKDTDKITDKELQSLANYLVSLSSAEEINEFIMSGYTEERYEGWYVCSDTYKSVIAATELTLLSNMIKTKSITENEYLSQMMKLEMIKLKSSSVYIPTKYPKDDALHMTFNCIIEVDSDDSEIRNLNYPESWITKRNYPNWLYQKFIWDATARYIGCGASANINKDISTNFDFSSSSDKTKQLLANIAQNAGLAAATQDMELPASVVTSVLLGLPDINSNPDLNKGDFINDMKLHVVEIEDLEDYEKKAKDWLGRSNTEKSYTVYPSQDTIEAIDELNKQINSIKNNYVDNNQPIPLINDTLTVFKDTDKENPLFELKVNTNNTVSLENIENINVSDLLTNPNMTNELYCLVQLLNE